jgi:hypothetical protein
MAKPTAAFLAIVLFTMLSASATTPSKGPTQAELSAATANAAGWLHPNHRARGGLLLTHDRGLVWTSRMIDAELRPWFTACEHCFTGGKIS